MTYYTVSIYNYDNSRPHNEHIVIREDFSYEEFEECELAMIDSETTWIMLDHEMSHEFVGIEFYYACNTTKALKYNYKPKAETFWCCQN